MKSGKKEDISIYQDEEEPRGNSEGSRYNQGIGRQRKDGLSITGTLWAELLESKPINQHQPAEATGHEEEKHQEGCWAKEGF